MYNANYNELYVRIVCTMLITLYYTHYMYILCMLISVDHTVYVHFMSTLLITIYTFYVYIINCTKLHILYSCSVT